MSDSGKIRTLEFSHKKVKWFAWRPVKTPDGWVWLQWVWKETKKYPLLKSPILRFIGDEKYRKECMENIENV